MTKRDFFRIIIKLFGLYALILTVFTYIPTNIGYVTFQFELASLLWILGGALLAFAAYFLLIINTNRIINFLKIDRGFDEERIELGNFNNNKILKLGIILIGGFMIVDYLPTFLHYSYLAFKSKVSNNGLNSLDQMEFGMPSDYLYWVVSGVNLVVGYIFLTNYHRIADWLTRKEKIAVPTEK